jgi:hypothetical protein
MLQDPLVRSLLIRAVRTFLQTFLAVILAAPVLDLSGAGLKAAGLAGLTSVLTMIHRLLDETPVPSLPDTTPGPAAGPATAPAAEPSSSVVG